MMKSAPVISFMIGPPTTPAISAILWHLGWLFRNSPCKTAVYVLSACQPMTLSAPPTAPNEYIAAGIDRTPRAKIVLRKMTVAIGHPTVRKLTPSLVCLKTSKSSVTPSSFSGSSGCVPICRFFSWYDGSVDILAAFQNMDKMLRDECKEEQSYSYLGTRCCNTSHELPQQLIVVKSYLSAPREVISRDSKLPQNRFITMDQGRISVLDIVACDWRVCPCFLFLCMFGVRSVWRHQIRVKIGELGSMLRRGDDDRWGRRDK